MVGLTDGVDEMTGQPTSPPRGRKWVLLERKVASAIKMMARVSRSESPELPQTRYGPLMAVLPRLIGF